MECGLQLSNALDEVRLGKPFELSAPDSTCCARCVQEWFNFVDREKQLRMHIAAQVTQLAEDAADLQAWTVSQVSCGWAALSCSLQCRCWC